MIKPDKTFIKIIQKLEMFSNFLKNRWPGKMILIKQVAKCSKIDKIK